MLGQSGSVGLPVWLCVSIMALFCRDHAQEWLQNLFDLFSLMPPDAIRAIPPTQSHIAMMPPRKCDFGPLPQPLLFRVTVAFVFSVSPLGKTAYFPVRSDLLLHSEIPLENPRSPSSTTTRWNVTGQGTASGLSLSAYSVRWGKGAEAATPAAISISHGAMVELPLSQRPRASAHA